MQHRNAPLTATGRLRTVLLVEEQGLTFEAAAAASNVPKSTVHLWVTRWRRASAEERATLGCLEDRSSTPKSSPNQVSATRPAARALDPLELGLPSSRDTPRRR